MKEILDYLNPRKAVGADSISPRLLRLLAPVMAEEITSLINFLIASRSWPDGWKCGNLTRVFKNDEDTRKENYRPVSVLTAFSMRKLCTINFIKLSVATCHKTSLDF